MVIVGSRLMGIGAEPRAEMNLVGRYPDVFICAFIWMPVSFQRVLSALIFLSSSAPGVVWSLPVEPQSWRGLRSVGTSPEQSSCLRDSDWEGYGGGMRRLASGVLMGIWPGNHG